MTTVHMEDEAVKLSQAEITVQHIVEHKTGAYADMFERMDMGAVPKWTVPWFEGYMEQVPMEDGHQMYEHCDFDEIVFHEKNTSDHMILDTLMHDNALHRPRHFLNKEGTELIILCKVKHRLGGHVGLVHGGFTAALLDHALGTICFNIMKKPATKTL
eukprot:Platyproteum_vivax@DN8517_c0_g1_i1.p1